jgi:hypothetical protein
MHHIVPRSRSSKLKWDPRNNCLLCKGHHDLRHNGIIQISGDADGELVITGDVACGFDSDAVAPPLAPAALGSRGSILAGRQK